MPTALGIAARSLVARAVFANSAAGGEGGGGFACALPLGATEAEVQGFGYAGRLTLSESEQRGTKTTSGTDSTFAAFPTNSLTSPTTFDLTSGKKVIEWPFTTQEIEDVGSSGLVTCDANVINTSAQTIARASVRRSAGAGALGVVRIFIGATQVYQNTDFDLSAGVTIGFEFNSADNTLRAIASSTAGNNVELVLDSNTYVPSASGLHFINVSEISIAGVDVGKVFGMTARTSEEVITQTYGSGATDLCGNALGA